MVAKLMTFLWRTFLFAIATLLSQVGGLIYLLHLLIFSGIQKQFKLGRWAFWARKLSFCALYLLLTNTFVPWLAARYSRVPMPVTKTGALRPVNLWTCILNRHYVRPELLRTTYGVSEAMSVKYPGTVTHYLEAATRFGRI
jgi:hypothetical protein